MPGFPHMMRGGHNADFSRAWTNIAQVSLGGIGEVLVVKLSAALRCAYFSCFLGLT